MHINSVFWVPAALLLIEGASGSRVERKSEELLPGPMVTNAFFLLAFHWEEHCFLQSLIEFPLSWYKVETGIAAALAPNRTFGTTEKIRPWDIALLVDL